MAQIFKNQYDSNRGAKNIILQASCHWLKMVFYLLYQILFYVALYVWEELPSKRIVFCGLSSLQNPKDAGDLQKTAATYRVLLSSFGFSSFLFV